MRFGAVAASCVRLVGCGGVLLGALLLAAPAARLLPPAVAEALADGGEGGGAARQGEAGSGARPQQQSAAVGADGAEQRAPTAGVGQLLVSSAGGDDQQQQVTAAGAGGPPGQGSGQLPLGLAAGRWMLRSLLGPQALTSVETVRWEAAAGQLVLEQVSLQHAGLALQATLPLVEVTVPAQGGALQLALKQPAVRWDLGELLARQEDVAAPADARSRKARRAQRSKARRQKIERVRRLLLALVGPDAAWTRMVSRIVLEGGSLELAHPKAGLRLQAVKLQVRSGQQVELEGELLGPAGGQAHLQATSGWLAAADDGELSLEGAVELSLGRVRHNAVAPEPVEGLSGRAAGRLGWRPERGRLELKLGELVLQGIEAQAALKVKGLGSSDVQARLTVGLREQPCQRLADALPQGLAPLLAGHARLKGKLGGDLVLQVDTGDREEPISALRMRWPGLRRCRIVSLGPHVDVERLGSSRYVHTVTPPDPELPQVKVGPRTRSYVPLDELPAHVLRSMVVTENVSFHKGGPISLSLIRKALNIDLRKGRYVYGGSTISQQLVKNLFLGPDKTLSRKLQEAFIAWHMEQTISKERILELYVNCIEFAPGVYGIERAARYYFGHGARELTPVEGAFLATIKPLPADGPRMGRKGKIDGWWYKRVIEVMEILEQTGEITPEERQAAHPYQPQFRPPEDFERRKRRGRRRRR